MILDLGPGYLLPPGRTAPGGLSQEKSDHDFGYDFRQRPRLRGRVEAVAQCLQPIALLAELRAFHGGIELDGLLFRHRAVDLGAEECIVKLVLIGYDFGKQFR